MVAMPVGVKVLAGDTGEYRTCVFGTLAVCVLGQRWSRFEKTASKRVSSRTSPSLAEQSLSDTHSNSKSK